MVSVNQAEQKSMCEVSVGNLESGSLVSVFLSSPINGKTRETW